MKTRIVAGLVASLALFTAASADAGPKKHAPGAARRPAATARASETKPASLITTNNDAATKPAADKASPKAVDKPADKASSKPADKASPKPAKHVEKAKPSRGAKHAKKAPARDADHETKPASLSTVESAPAPKGHVGKKASLSRFMASGIPLAEVRDGRLHGVATPKHPCGVRASWSKKGSQWTALDAWGQVAGTLTVSGSDQHDGTGCHQVSFAEGTGKDGLGVFVSKGSGYSPAPSVRWSPAADVEKRFERLYASQATAWIDGKPAASAEHGKTLFFSLPKQEGSPEGAPTERRPTHWAVSGGRVLIVAYVGATGSWKVGHVLAPTGKDDAYQPLAVMDMDGDGLPEIVVHEESSGVFNDRVLSFDAGAMRWEKTVESPGGATP
ncbi:MAG: hypothetical protein U0441_11165 [Polyangiaceae bacterium]